MPSCGSFSLSLVDADSLDELREYGDVSSVSWVKANSGDEFFVVVRCELNESVKCFIKVDGTSIGYSWLTHSPSTSDPLGPIKGGQASDGNEIVTHAFRFVHQSVADEKLSSFGTVEATWYSVKDTYTPSTPNLRSWDGDANADAPLRSCIGSMPGSIPSFDGTSWIIDEKLASLSLHYTSEIGLSVRGLLEEESPLKRKEAEKEAEEDDVVEIPPPQTTKRVKSEYRIITCGDGKEVIEIM